MTKEQKVALFTTVIEIIFRSEKLRTAALGKTFMRKKYHYFMNGSGIDSEAANITNTEDSEVQRKA